MSPATSIITAILALGIIYNGVQMIRHKSETARISTIDITRLMSDCDGVFMFQSEEVDGQLFYDTTCKENRK